MTKSSIVIGVVSDTHGLYRSELDQSLNGVDLILHAGDIGSRAVIEQLSLIAPVRAVAGNTDRFPLSEEYPETDVVEVKGKLIYIIHDLNKLDIDPVAAHISVVIAGHSHQAAIQYKNDVLFFNPGSAGPKRFKTTPSCGKLLIENELIIPEILIIKLEN